MRNKLTAKIIFNDGTWKLSIPKIESVLNFRYQFIQKRLALIRRVHRVCPKNINYPGEVSSSGSPVLSSLTCLPSSFHYVTVCRLLFPPWETTFPDIIYSDISPSRANRKQGIRPARTRMYRSMLTIPSTSHAARERRVKYHRYHRATRGTERDPCLATDVSRAHGNRVVFDLIRRSTEVNAKLISHDVSATCGIGFPDLARRKERRQPLPLIYL